MTYEEAYKLVKGCGFNIEAPLHNEVEDLVLSAIKKQIQIRPNQFELSYARGIYSVCPSCRNILINSPAHCDKCGQALDWEGTI